MPPVVPLLIFLLPACALHFADLVVVHHTLSGSSYFFGLAMHHARATSILWYNYVFSLVSWPNIIKIYTLSFF